MSYTNQDLRNAFYAGKLGGISFDAWLVKHKSFDKMVSLYQHCFIKFADVPASYGLNVRTTDCMKVKHILRGSLMQNVKNLTLKVLCHVELMAGSNEKTDHTTIMNSVDKYNESFQDSYIDNQIKKLIDEYKLC